jgi:hypothetical protein
MNRERARTERTLPERAIRRLRFHPGITVRAFVISSVADDDVHGTALMHVKVVHRMGPFVGMHVAIEHEINARVEKDLLERFSHTFSLFEVSSVGIVPRRVKHDDDPRGILPIDGG